MIAFWAVAPGAYALPKNDPILEADRLIAAQNYNEAILFLTDFIKLYPERFDEAQARLKIVIEKRAAYNKKAAELLNVLINDPTNEPRKIALIRELEGMDKNPNQDIKKTLENTKMASLFVYNKTQYDKILADGRALLDQGKYAEAAGVYESGFVLYRPEFDDGPYDELTKKSVASLVDKIKSEVSSFSQVQSSLVQIVKVFSDALAAGDIASAETAWPAAKAALEDRARRRNGVIGAGRALSVQFEAIRKLDPNATDSSFLPFAFRLTLGRSTSILPEGIAGAMDSQWIVLLNQIEVSFSKELDSLYAQAETAFDAGRWEEAAVKFENVAGLAQPGLAALGLWSLVAPTDFLPSVSQYGKTLLAGKPTAYERAKHLAAAASSQARLARLEASVLATTAQAKDFAAKSGSSSSLTTVLTSLAAYRASLVGFATEIARESTKAASEAAELLRWTGAGLGDERSTVAQASYEKRTADLAALARRDEISIVALASGIEYADIDKRFAERKAGVAQGRLLLQGSPSGAGSLLARYPTQSSQVLLAEATMLASFRQRLSGYIEKLKTEVPYVIGDGEVAAYLEKASLMAEEAKALEADRASTLAKALEQKKQAEAAKADAELRIQQARLALANDDFDTARDRLAKADGRYVDSFAFEENPELRASSDALRQKLGSDIIKAENDKVVRDTRSLITQGKSFYFQSAFAKSEDVLLQARLVWKKTHGEDPEPEVEYWIRLAQTALSIKTGRDIPTTAPLYPEMSQLLSLARTYFDQGKTSLNKGRKTDAIQSFSLAKQAINQVKVIFPQNQEAGVLALRIDQLTDPVVFKQTFAAKFQEYKAGIEVNPREAYSNLQDLAAIDPKYPGLSAAINTAEMALGLRAAPVDKTKVRQANALVAAAKAIVDSGDSGRYSFALTQVNEALRLDPNNDNAIALKDKLQGLIGGTEQLVLSSYAEGQYRAAILEFQNGNYLQANAIVQQLLLDPKNQKSTKIIDLSKKIQARL